jgi:hypothetical protein
MICVDPAFSSVVTQVVARYHWCFQGPQPLHPVTAQVLAEIKHIKNQSTVGESGARSAQRHRAPTALVGALARMLPPPTDAHLHCRLLRPRWLTWPSRSPSHEQAVNPPETSI